MSRCYKLIYTTGMGTRQNVNNYSQSQLTRNVNIILKNKKYDPSWSVVEIQIVEG